MEKERNFWKKVGIILENKLKKAMVAASIVLGLSVSSLGNSASADVERSSSGHSFVADWKGVAEGKTWVMHYGFDTTLINEDYTKTKHMSRAHIAKVKNANGTHADSDSAGNWAGIEVRHKGSTIYYYLD